MGFSCNPIFVTLSAEVARVKNKPVLKIENKLLARDQKLLEWGINMKIFFTNFLRPAPRTSAKRNDCLQIAD